jgi:putative cell wall-binding protein
MSKSKKAKSIALLLALAFVFTSLFSGIGAVAFAADEGARIYGDNRIETAVEISKEGWEASDNVVLVYGGKNNEPQSFADALAAGPLAKKLDAPILLTEKDELPDVTADEIARLDATKVYIVGGEKVVYPAVAEDVEDIDGVTVERIAGADRYATAVAVAEELVDLGVSADKVILARGDDYADALAAAAVKDVLPILFAGKAGADSLQAATEDALVDLGVEDVVIVGGEEAVSDDIEDDVKDIVSGDVTRIGEDDRFKTAVAIADAFKPADGYKGAVLATGYNYADALAGGPYAAKNSYAMLLTGKASNPLDAAAVDFIEANTGIKADTIVALGGPVAVPDAAIEAAVEAATPALPAIVSAKALDSDTVRVTFNTEIQDVDFTNFSVDHGLVVTKATLSSDKKSVDVDVNEAFTREVEYKLTASGIKNTRGDVAPDLTATFVWSVNDAVTVALTKTTLKDKETASVTVKDQDGKDVTVAKVEITSSNTNIVDVDDTDDTIEGVAAGTADVTVKVTLLDDTVLTNTFKVTVEAVSAVVADQGFTLVGNIAEAPENTVAFKNGDKVTSMYTGKTKVVAMYQTKDNDPETAPVNFTGATVRSLNPTIATAAISGGVMTITATSQTGKASFEVTFSDGSKRTFSVDVKKAPELAGITVDVTNVKLSDESASGNQEGVNQKTVKVTAVDQYGNPIEFTDGKVTVTTNTEGLELGGLSGQNSNELDFSSGETATFTITATAGVINSGNVYVKYFKKADDTSATATKTIAVKVVDVNPAATKVGLEVVAAGEIDAYADYTPNPLDVDSIYFNDEDYVEVYVLDANGNRLKKVTTPTVKLVGTDSWVEVPETTTTLKFIDEVAARTFLTKSGTAKVNVVAEGITKQLSITYKNSAKVPASATVATSPVTVKLSDDTALTIEELIFGVIDTDQLVLDEEMNEYIAVKSAATNGGYKYNKPLVTVKDASGAVLPIGANVYGLNADAENGNIWADEELVDDAVFSSVNFDVDFRVTNVEVVDKGTPTNASLDTGTGTVTVTDSGDTVRFTLVIDAICVDGGDADNNLLAGPVAVNVTVTK